MQPSFTKPSCRQVNFREKLLQGKLAKQERTKFIHLRKFIQ